jgi:hypothetical protein
MVFSGNAGATGTVPGQNFYESFDQNECASSTMCFIEFDRVPTGLWLKARNLWCEVHLAPAGNYTRVTLFQGPVEKFVLKGKFVAPAQQPGAAGSAYYINEQILSFFQEGKKPQAFVDNATADLRIACKLSGSLVTP